MKKIILASIFTMGFMSSSYAQIGAYAGNAAADSLMAGVTGALSRAGQAVGSAAAAIARGNAGRILGRAVGLAGGPVGLVSAVAIGLILEYDKGQIISNPDGTITVNHIKPVSTAKGYGPGDQIWTLANAGSYTGAVFSDSVTSLLALYIAANSKGSDPNYQIQTLNDCWQTTSGTIQYYCNSYTSVSGKLQTYRQYVAYKVGAPNSCPAGQIYDGSACVNDPSASNQTVSETVSAGEVADHLTEDELNTPVQPGPLSDFWNLLGQYLGGTSTPIPTTTAADYPPVTGVKVRDLVTPLTGSVTPTVNPTTAPATDQTATTTKPTTSTTTNNTTNINLGDDPGITAPVLNPNIPSESSILAPYLNLLPDFKNLAFGSNGGACPFNQTFTLFGKSNYSFRFVCDLLDSVYSLIHAGMVAAFLIFAVIIILGA
jgi:hypothetical protein